jgi:DnaJ-class molecular chaperone
MPDCAKNIEQIEESECLACEGSGAVEHNCRQCNGSGEGCADGTTCHSCHGRGSKKAECEDCDGRGFVEEDDEAEEVEKCDR